MVECEAIKISQISFSNHGNLLRSVSDCCADSVVTVATPFNCPRLNASVKIEICHQTRTARLQRFPFYQFGDQFFLQSVGNIIKKILFYLIVRKRCSGVKQFCLCQEHMLDEHSVKISRAKNTCCCQQTYDLKRDHHLDNQDRPNSGFKSEVGKN